MRSLFNSDLIHIFSGKLFTYLWMSPTPSTASLSIVSVAEVMQGPLKKGFHQNAEDVKNYLINFPNIFCQEITTDVLEHIGRNNLIEWSKLRTIDSLIIASGLEQDVELFVSNDDHFKRAIPRDLMLSFNL